MLIKDFSVKLSVTPTYNNLPLGDMVRCRELFDW